MKAVRFDRFGGPEVLRIVELPDPRPGPGEIRIRVRAAGINASIELIHRTWGSTWPDGPVTEEENFIDLVWHEREFRDGDSFTYVIYRTDHTYLGCCYLYPMGRRRPLTSESVRHDVDASWWVTPDAYADGYYSKVYAGLQVWLRQDLPFAAPYFSNAELPQLEP